MVVLAYNLPGLTGPLRLSASVYAEHLRGRIRTWDDPRIRAANPDLNLPKPNIAIVARQDGSGTTFAFTNHPSAISEAWRDRGPRHRATSSTGAARRCWPAATRRGRPHQGERIDSTGYVE